MTTLSQTYVVVLALFAAAAAGLVGAFALMRRTVLAGDVMSHIALPGLGLALLYKINPIFGGAATLLIGILAIWKLEERTALTSEAAIGVIFAASVALGAILTPAQDLEDALFGGFGSLRAYEFVAGLAVSVLILLALWLLRHRLIIALFSQELAAATGIDVSRLNLVFLLVFGLAIILGLRFLGALLVGSLIIIPASTARQLTHTLGAFLIASTLISLLSTGLGFVVSDLYGFGLGPTIAIVASVLFGLSLLKKKT
jgi:ABC-type Mn2+/Zn2+ transport system permease subunit